MFFNFFVCKFALEFNDTPSWASRVSYKGKYHEGANLGTGLSGRLIEGVRLIGGPLNRSFNVYITHTFCDFIDYNSVTFPTELLGWGCTFS